MAQITDPAVLEALPLEPGETAWEHFDVDKVFLQSACPDCDRGLLYAPARFCGRCGGSGFADRVVPMPKVTL